MALIVFLRGVNVGGHRTFRPSTLARELSDYDVVSVGAAGTFVVRKPGLMFLGGSLPLTGPGQIAAIVSPETSPMTNGLRNTPPG